MVQLPYLQPFDDVNKRVSRLAANIPLIRHNLSPLSFTDVPRATYTDAMLGVYELNRIELLRDVFIWAYERSAARYAAVRQSLGEPDPFRLRYRPASRVVGGVVRARMGRKQAAGTSPDGQQSISPQPTGTVPGNCRGRAPGPARRQLRALSNQAIGIQSLGRDPEPMNANAD